MNEDLIWAWLGHRGRYSLQRQATAIPGVSNAFECIWQGETAMRAGLEAGLVWHAAILISYEMKMRQSGRLQ